MLHRAFYGEELNLSDRMVAKGSGTDPARGNTPQKVAEWFRKNWSALDEDWPMAGVKTVDEYYKEFPDILYSQAEVVRNNNKFGYEAITNPTKLKLKDALTKGAVCMSVALMIDENGLYYKPAGWRDGHWVTLVHIRPDGNYVILDSYSPYLKVVRADFIPEVAYRYTLNEEVVDGIIVGIRDIIKKLAEWVATQIKPAPKPEPKLIPKQVLQNTLCMAIQKHEGFFPGSRSQRNNNPANARYSSVGYLPIYGEVGEDREGVPAHQRGYAIFKNYETGFLYLKNLVLHKARKHPDWTLTQFIGDEKEGWAPASDNNNVDAYASALANAIKVDKKTWKLAALL